MNQSQRIALAGMCLAILGLPLPIHSQVGLELSLKFSKEQYMLGEPLKLTAVLRNTSEESIQIVNVWELTYTDNRCLFLELEDQPGRRWQTQYTSGEGFGGWEPLAPGDSVVALLYPTRARYYDDSGVPGGGTPFPSVGEYRVQLVYSTDRKYVWLGVPPKNIVRSNVVALRFVEPDSTSKEILDLIWTSCGGRLGEGDVSYGGTYDQAPLRRMIARYPEHELASYLRMDLAGSLTSVPAQVGTTSVEVAEAIELVKDAMTFHPDFRTEEMTLLLAMCYRWKYDIEAARRTMNRLMEEHPELKSNRHFMSEYLVCEYRNSTLNAISQWLKNRKNGVPNPHIISFDEGDSNN